MKLNYLIDLKKQNKKPQGSDFKKYFQELEGKFKGEVDLIKELDSILKNYNDVAEKEAEIGNKESRIEAHTLLIDDK